MILGEEQRSVHLCYEREEHVVQPLLVNLSEISLATECVGMILKIDDVIAPQEYE